MLKKASCEFFRILIGACRSNRRSSAGFAGAIRCSGGGIGRGAEPPSEFLAAAVAPFERRDGEPIARPRRL